MFSRLKERMSLNEACVCARVCVHPSACACASPPTQVRVCVRVQEWEQRCLERLLNVKDNEAEAIGGK